MSNVAFYPVFPLLATLTARTFALSAEAAVAVTANFAAFCCLVLFSLYLKRRWPHDGVQARQWTLVICGLFPTTFFWRMGYTESTFAALGILLFLLMTYERSPYLLALVVTVLCATRPTGVAFLAPLLIYVWERKHGLGDFALKSVLVVLLSALGCAAFVAFQWSAFGEALAFLKTQAHWQSRPVPGVGRIVVDLLSLEPLRATYKPSSLRVYWGSFPPRNTPEFNIMFWTPLLFVGSLVALLVGWRRRILTGKEATAALLLCLIPYCLQGPRAGMASMARYCSVAFPVYMVLAKFLLRLPPAAISLLCSLLAVMLFAMTALFARWYWLY